MTWTPGTGCSVSSFRTNSSAGGQLEHPSDVKSSTTTGRLPTVGVTAPFAAGRDWPTDLPVPATHRRIAHNESRCIPVSLQRTSDPWIISGHLQALRRGHPSLVIPNPQQTTGAV